MAKRRSERSSEAKPRESPSSAGKQKSHLVARKVNLRRSCTKPATVETGDIMDVDSDGQRRVMAIMH
ncbi:hypothetical protein BRADI_4g34755v3 [Brachypodium distachyon]|uniref:Uncharacterized protein n=1 Tax=Brachypodium distachyon TaxID=15368 RepID=A0A0Q3ETV7_BRADI|nr:hypothetical protein BRADI_4g34755v3 [Brachypodium distachyon]